MRSSKSLILTLLLTFSTNLLAFKANDSLVMHLDASSLQGSCTNGQKIALWNDVSGSDNNAQQSQADNQPVFVASDSQFNNCSVVRFDGSNDWLNIPADMINVHSYTMFAVARHARTNMEQYIIAGQSDGGDNRARMGMDHEARFVWRAGNSGVITRASDTGVHVFSATSELEAYFDGGHVGEWSNGSRQVPNSLNLGSYNRGEKNFLLGDIAEVLIFDRVLTGDEINEVGAYLELKYALNTAYKQLDMKVKNVSPSPESMNIPFNKVLSWNAPDGDDSPAYNVYMGTDKDELALVSQAQTRTAFDPLGAGLLKSDTKYYWRVDIDGFPEPGDINTFITRPASSVKSLDADLNEDSVVDVDDLSEVAEPWLQEGENKADIDKNGIVNIHDFSSVGTEWKKTGKIPAGYVISRPDNNCFQVVAGDTVCSIYVDANDHEVCQIAADLLAGDIENVCGVKPAVINDINSASGNVIIIGTLGKSSVVDSLAAKSKINISDISGSWETFALETLKSPVASVDNALVIYGSDRRGTAFGVFDLSENLGISPWNWWADVPVNYRDHVYVRSGRYKQGPPSVKYRGIFINDEDWGLQPWARNTYSPEDGYIGPKAHRKIFELLLRLKANYLWPAMHRCTKGFHGFADNKIVADQYAIVMGSSHCEQMSRDNEWEWYRYAPKDGSDKGPWDWCTNGAGLTQYWREAVEANGQYENIYTTGMRGIHDSGMPCSGATDAQKVLAMQNEIFPAQRQIIADLVNPDVTKVPQIFCPYKEVLGLYNLGLEVPDDITLVWPDDNFGYIRRLSNAQEQQRSGGSGVYYHLSYLGPPMEYLWLPSVPPSLVWEELTKAYANGADRLWVFNVGDIKPAEIGMDYSMRLAWNIDSFTCDNVDEYLEAWSWQQFGPEYKHDIADILAQYYRLSQTRKPEHMASGGLGFTMTDFGDEIERRIEQYKDITDRAANIYTNIPARCKDAYYQLVLYPVRCAYLMNQKILYARKNAVYASQGRVVADKYAAMATNAYQQIIAETDYYNNVMADGKWKDVISWTPRNMSVFRMPATSSVSPVNGPSMGVIIEGCDQEIAGGFEPSPAYSDYFTDGIAQNFQSINQARWSVRDYGSGNEYAINTSSYENLSGDRLGELSVLNDHCYDYFDLSCQVRSCDSFASNGSADLALVFGYQDPMNYYYLILCNNSANSALHHIANGIRNTIKGVDIAIPDNQFHDLAVKYNASGLTISYSGKNVVISGVFHNGQIGFGSYNDSAAFTALEVQPLDNPVTPDMLPQFDVFTKQRHFIDIFNKGNNSFVWSTNVSANWIKLSAVAGSVSDQQRIWVTLDWQNVPFGTHDETITIAGPQGEQVVNVSVFNPQSPRPADIADCFVESKGCVSIEAENYSNCNDVDGAGWREITTLGSTGDSITVQPFDMASAANVAQAVSNYPSVEYNVYLWNAGDKKVTVRAIPTHAVSSDHGLRYAVAFDDQQPVMVEFDTLEWSSQWNLNVLQGVAIPESIHNIDSVGKHKLKIWMVDPGVVIDKIIIGTPAASHTGPQETRVVK